MLAAWDDGICASQPPVDQGRTVTTGINCLPSWLL
jgi:hypothetical protein